MNLQEEMLKAIKDGITPDSKIDAFATYYGEDETAKSCAEIAERNAIEFAGWLGKNAYHNDDYWYVISTENEEITIAELYQLFLNSKDNES